MIISHVKLLFMIISHVKIIASQLSLFCKNYRFSNTVLYIINRKIHGWLEIPNLFLVLNMTSQSLAALTCEIKSHGKRKNFSYCFYKMAYCAYSCAYIPDCLSNIYLLEVEIYSDHWMKKTLNKYWSINRNVFYFIVLQFYFYTIKIKYKHAA